MDVLAPPTTCPKCQGTAFYDNRGNKKSPKGPDFKCKNCGEGFWLKGEAVTSRPAAPAYRERLPQPATKPVHTAGYGETQDAVPDGVSFQELKKRFGECVEFAIDVSLAMNKAEIGIDPRATAQMADTLFIQRCRMGI